MNDPSASRPPSESPVSLWIASDLGEAWLAVLLGDRPYELLLRGEEHQRLLGAIFKGRVSGSARAVGASFVQIGGARDAFLMDGRAQEARPPAIGEELLIQIVREADGGKGPRATRSITLAGSNLVLAPGGPSGVSRRIDDDAERDRLRALLGELAPEGFGLIARTSAVGAVAEDLAVERDELLDRWGEIALKAASLRAPALVYRDPDPAIPWVRDHLALAPQRIVVDGPGADERLAALSQISGLPAVQRFSGPLPAVEALRLDHELLVALSPFVPLPSGGRLIIEATEALTSIDVNSGRDLSAVDLERTALHTNLEAVPEIARQIRLRDVGGMVVVDFIDMARHEHRAQVDQALAAALTDDRAKLRILPLTDFCLAQITRQRRRPPLARQVQEPCAACRRGPVLRPEALARQLLRTLRTLARPRPTGKFIVRAPEEALLAAQEIAERWGAESGLPGLERVIFREGDPEVEA